MTTIYVDESGDLGQKGERFFVIALVIPQNCKRIKNIIKHFCSANKLEEVKACQLKFPEKQNLLKKLVSVDDHSISYIVADKNNIRNKKLFEDKNLIYNYLFQWLIKSIIKNSSEDIDIILDNHSIKVKSINSLRDYIKIKAYAEWGVTSNISIRYIDSKDCKAIQIADIIANVVYGHYLHDKPHLYGMMKIEKSIKFPEGQFNT